MRSTPSPARNCSAAAMSPGRSPQIVMCASSTPSSSNRSAIHGPLRSCTRPVRTSVPVTTMPARALTNWHAYTTTCSPRREPSSERLVHRPHANARAAVRDQDDVFDSLPLGRGRRGAQLDSAQYLAQHDPQLDHCERRAEAAAVPPPNGSHVVGPVAAPTIRSGSNRSGCGYCAELLCTNPIPGATMTPAGRR